MEKLVYVLWCPSGARTDDFSHELRSSAAGWSRLGARRVAVNVVDSFVAPVMSARLTRLDPPPAAVVSFWLDACDDRGPIEAELARRTERFAGYLVVESVPLVNTTRTAAAGERTPGINMIALIERPERVSYDRWIEHWHGHHKRVALETQCTYAYVRNVVVRPLTAGAPPWAGIVEEGFPAEAVTNPMLWYRGEGSEETLQKNFGRMIESVQAFLDIDRVESHPMSEYILSN
ncbi:MAG TPA: hypothetical protein VFO62_03510 [Candidatus Binatia bacterium]|nr:hypothetical protein [Candidatus Binatia bacterium]